MDDRAPKRLRTTQKVIGTHNGTFHCDEALACFLLRKTASYEGAAVTRSRDPNILENCDIVVDVGAIYDHEKSRYDHHQRGFEEIFGFGYNTKLSSAGLIYKHFGKEIISSRMGLPVDDPKIELLWLKLYKEFIEAIDGIDNGISQYPADSVARYTNRTDLSTRVSWLNPSWNEPCDAKTVDVLFEQASEMTGVEFFQRLDYYANSWLPGRDIVESVVSDRYTVHSSGRIVAFERFAPWKEHLFDIEEELKLPHDEKPLYVIYPDETASNWRIQAVPISPSSFQSRKALPSEWCGLRDEALSQKIGIQGCIFVHASGFIGGNMTRDGVLAMAFAALESN